MKESTIWRGEHAGLGIEIVRWSFGVVISTLPETNWNYYVVIREDQTKQFSELWLPPKIVKITPESKGFLTHDYSSLDIANIVEWHGGVTFYEKYGEVEGYRAVKLGCDFQHLFDIERGYPYIYEEVLAECKNTAQEVAALL